MVEGTETNPVPIVPVPMGWGRSHTARNPVHKGVAARSPLKPLTGLQIRLTT